MNTDPRQLILLAVAIIVPLILMRKKQDQWLLGWVSLTLFVQIFDTTVITNLPAARIVGLLYLPTAIASLQQWSRLPAVKAALINLLYLAILGLLFGFLWPWPDLTRNRPFTLTAPGRTMIFLVRLLSDLSLAAFIAWQVSMPGALRLIGRAVVIGATLNSAVGLFNLFTGIDLCHLITGQGEALSLTGRARGLAIEPRAMGLVCVYGLMALLIGRRRLFSWWPGLLLLNLLGLLITHSVSSFAMFAAGLLAAMFFLSGRVKAVALATALSAGLIIAGAWLLAPEIFEAGLQTVQIRVDPQYKLSGIANGTFGEEVAYRMDVFDASAMLFLLDQPLYALFGTGPGLVSLPASDYVPPGLYSLIWTPDTGINSLPSQGLLLEISNSGLPGLLLWFWQVIACLIALRQLRNLARDTEHEEEWQFAWAFFLSGVVFYIVHLSHTPVWSLVLGVGWAGSVLADLARRREFEFTTAEAELLEEWPPQFVPSGD